MAHATHEIRSTGGTWLPAWRLADGGYLVLVAPGRAALVTREVARGLKIRRTAHA